MDHHDHPEREPSVIELNRTYADTPKMFYEGSSDGGFPEANYFHLTFNSFPHHFYNDTEHLISTKLNDWLRKEFTLEEVWSTRYSVGKKIVRNNALYRVQGESILIKLHAYSTYGDDNNPDIDIDDHHIHMYFSEYNDIVKAIIDATARYRIRKSGKGNKISLVTTSRSGELSTKEFEIKIDPIDVGLNYGEEFVPVYQKILKRLNTKHDKGLVLFHGRPGTGKSSLIKYIAKNLKKEVLFIPPHMAESITSPGFVPFLTSHNNSVLIIEDAERIISSRESHYTSSEGVSNILNISDGILGDCLGIQIIATFNTARANIDEALMRKGRLIAEHEFSELSAANANILLGHLGISTFTATKPMTLTEIYNVEDTEYKSEKKRQAIGFNR